MKKIFGFMSFLALAGAFASCQRQGFQGRVLQK